ncbi:hypothetical protein V8G54_037612 [Vigna mungo]|uniref:Uncharacterized protein n=1 Tax=Vigna mungo TaxID=3915 RepID=A0AAQ3RGN5_VIGMU
MQQETYSYTHNVASGTLEHFGHCASQSRAKGTISLTYMLRQQPHLDVEVHAPRPLLVPPLPPLNIITSRFQCHPSPSPSLFHFFSSSLIAIHIVSFVDSALQILETYKERDIPEGLIPHLVARLCVLLCIVPLAIANVQIDASEFMQIPIQKQVNFMELDLLLP